MGVHRQAADSSQTSEGGGGGGGGGGRRGGREGGKERREGRKERGREGEEGGREGRRGGRKGRRGGRKGRRGGRGKEGEGKERREGGKERREGGKGERANEREGNCEVDTKLNRHLAIYNCEESNYASRPPACMCIWSDKVFYAGPPQIWSTAPSCSDRRTGSQTVETRTREEARLEQWNISRPSSMPFLEAVAISREGCFLSSLQHHQLLVSCPQAGTKNKKFSW